jgi:hypothetical protein
MGNRAFQTDFLQELEGLMDWPAQTQTEFVVVEEGTKPHALPCPRCERLAAPEHITATTARCWWCETSWVHKQANTR